jgi:hypothetical protein
MSKFVLTAQLQLQAPSNVGQVVKKIQGQLKNVNVKIEAQGAAKSTRQIQQLTKAVKQADSAAFRLGKTFTSSLKRFAAFSIATRFVSLFTQGLGGAIDEAIKFERELIKVAQVTGRTIKQLGELTDEIKKLSISLGVSSTELLNVSRALSQAGFSASETKIALDALAKSSLAPTFEDMAKTAEGAIAIFNQFGKGALALEAQLGAINAVAGKFAVEAGDLIAVIRRTGGVFKAAGGDLNELIALFTSVRSTTRESAESIATGLRTIFTRIQRPTTIKFLEGLGVSLKDLEGKFVGPFEAIKRLSQALGDMKPGDLGFVQIAEQLGGFRQIGKVIPLLQQFSVAQEAYNTALAGTNSLSKDAETAQQSLAVQIAKLREEWMATVRSITGGAGFKVAITAALSLASAVLKIADALKAVLPMIAAFGALKMARGLGGFMAGAKAGGMGAVPKFATGGAVPGSGSRDTVPAMLTPGEFVIRKSSAQKIGNKNLQSMNSKGYATGGYAIKLQDNAVGGFYLRPNKGDDKSYNLGIGGTGDGKKSKPANLTSDTAIGSLLKLGSGLIDHRKATPGAAGLAGMTAADQAKALGTVPPDRYAPVSGKGTWTLGTGQLINSKGDVSEKAIKNLTGNGNTFKDASALKASVEADLKTSKFQGTSQASVPITVNGVVPGMILGDGGKKAQNSSTAAIDDAVRTAASTHLNAAIDDLLDKAGPIKTLLTTKSIGPIKIDTSGTAKSIKANLLDKEKGAVRTIAGYVQEGLVSAITGAEVPDNDNASFDFPDLGKSGSKIQQNLKLLYGGKDGKNAVATGSADAKPKADTTNTRKILKKYADSISKDPGKYVNANYIESVTGFAKGGPAPSDTVPAMLTPGEFVVNKKAAQSIGPAGLDRMNKKGVAGFAKGGPVGFASGGGVQGFALGGGMGGGGGSMQLMMMMTAFSAMLPMLQQGLEKAGKGSQELSEGINALKKGISVGIATFMMMKIPGMIIADQMKKRAVKEKEAADAAKEAADALGNVASEAEAIEAPKDIDADELSIAADGVSLDVSELIIHAKVVNLEAMGGGPIVTRSQTPQELKEVAIQEREKTLKEGLEGRADVGQIHRGEFKPGSNPDDPTGRGALDTQLSRLKNAEMQNRSLATRSGIDLAGNRGQGGTTLGLAADMKAAREQARVAQIQVTKQENNISGQGTVAGGMPGDGKPKPVNRAALEQYEMSLKQANEEIAKVAAQQEKHNLTVEAAYRAQEEYDRMIEETNAHLAELDISDAKTAAAPGVAALKEKAETQKILEDARDQDGRVDGSLMGYSDKQKARIKPLIARKESAIGERDNLKMVSQAGLGRAHGRNTRNRQGLEAQQATHQKGSRRWKELEVELQANAKKFKQINAQLDKNDKLNKATSKQRKLLDKEIKSLSRSIANGRRGIMGTFRDLKTGNIKLSSALKNSIKSLGVWSKNLRQKAGGNMIGKGIGKLGGMVGSIAPAVGGAAMTMMTALQDYQAQQFDKALASGSSADLRTASGMVEGNVDQEMATSRMGDTIAGAVAGASMGAMIGSIVPILGTAVGAAIGGVVGGAAGFFKDEIFSMMGLGPTREEKRKQKINEKHARIAETDLTKNIGPAMAKSMEAFATDGGQQTDLDATMKNIGLAQSAIATIRKADPEKADQAQKDLENQGTVLASTIGSTATNQAELDKRMKELTAKFPKLREELENTAKSAFMVAEANRATIKMKADILGTSSIFRAAGLEVNNFIDGLKTGANSWNATVNTLKEAQQNIALGTSAGSAVKDARDRVNKRLKESGVSETSEAGQMVNRQFDLMENAASFSSNLPNVLKSMNIDMGGKTDEAVKSDITAELQAAAGVDANSQMGKVIAAQVNAMTTEQMSGLRTKSLQLSDVFSDLQGQISQLGAGAMAAAQAMQAHENTMLKLTAAKIKAEQAHIAIQKQAIDLQLEGAMIASKFGGAAVGPDAKRAAALKKFNLGANRLGAGKLTTGSGADIRKSSASLTMGFAAQEMSSRRSGAFGGTGGLEADKRTELMKAQAELVSVTKALIQADIEELDIIKKKNALEKSSLDALIGGDVDAFEKQQRAAQATQVLAAGDTVGLSGFGADTLAAARENIVQQREAGVSEIGGVDIRTVENRATAAALSARGIDDPRAVALATGQTQEEQEVEGRIRERAGALGSIGANMADMAQMQVESAVINIQTAEVKFREGLNQAASQFNALTPARGGFIGSNAVYRALGGSIFKPKGTDTVPAMLTPGEFVVNRSSVNRGNNLQMLRAINSGNQSSEAAPAPAMSQGGQVSYYQSGGSVAGGMDASMLEGLNAFNTAFAKNIANLQNTKFQIKLDTTNVNVNLNGGSFLSSLKDEVKSELLAEIGSQISKTKFNDAGEPKVNNSVLG